METHLSKAATAALLAAALTAGGCGGPLGFIPGGSLGQPDQPFADLKLPAEGPVIELETRPRDPYSVKVGTVIINGRMYIDPAPKRTWYKHLSSNGEIRLRLDGDSTIYRARVYPVDDAQVRAAFADDRVPLRLGPR